MGNVKNMSKKNLILAGILVVLVAFSYVYNGPLQNSKKEKEGKYNFLTSLNINEVNLIEIKNGDNVTELELVENKWRVKGTKDFWVNDDLKGKIKELSEVQFELISTNSSKKENFKTDENGIVLKLKNNEELLSELVVGKLADDFISTYISKNNLNETYSAKVAGLNSIFSKSDWRDKTIFASITEDARKIRIQYPDKQYVIEKTEDIWSGIEPYNFKVDEEKIIEIIDLMTNFTATSIPKQTFEGTGLEKNSLIVQITGENGLDNTIMIGGGNSAENELFYAKKASSDNIYLISQEQKEGLEKNITTLQ